jgi:hypothetical protein
MLNRGAPATKHAWGLTAILLGAWETLALTTKRAPTITTSCRCACNRWPHTRLAIIVWAAMLTRHLTNAKGAR